MKTFHGLATNVYYVKNKDGNLEPQVEMIILCHEPQYELVSNQVVKRQMVTEERIHAPVKAVREILKSFDEELKKAEAEAGIK